MLKDCSIDIDILWKKYKKTKNKKIKLLLIEYYFTFVKKIAVKLAERLSWKVQPDALASFGIDGLYRAIENYDISIGVKFESYANRRIRGSMIDGLRREDQIPRSVRIRSDQFEKHKQRIQNYFGHNISDVDFVNIIGMNESKFHKERCKYSPISFISLDYQTDYDFEDGIRNDCNLNFIDSNVTGSDSNIRRREFFNKLMGNDFSKIEQKIIYLYYYKDMTMERIADYVCLSESRISQIHKQIIERLRKKIKKNPDYFDREILRFVTQGYGEKEIF